MARAGRRQARRIKLSGGGGGTRRLSWGGVRRRSTWKERGLIGAALLAVLGYLAWTWSSDAETEKQLLALVEQGRVALSEVELEPSLGRRHLGNSEPFTYPGDFPLSGPHDLVWTRPGVYDEPQRARNLVHALEHGNIVIYYDDPGAAVMEQLEAWAALYTGQWDGLVLTPRLGLGEGLVLTAWTRRLDLANFDSAAAAAFIDEYRGRGPEHRVR